MWHTQTDSPYYRESHKSLQREIRAYVDEEIRPFCAEWEKQGYVPDKVWN